MDSDNQRLTIRLLNSYCDATMYWRHLDLPDLFYFFSHINFMIIKSLKPVDLEAYTGVTVAAQIPLIWGSVQMQISKSIWGSIYLTIIPQINLNHTQISNII